VTFGVQWAEANQLGHLDVEKDQGLLQYGDDDRLRFRRSGQGLLETVQLLQSVVPAPQAPVEGETEPDRGGNGQEEQTAGPAGPEHLNRDEPQQGIDGNHKQDGHPGLVPDAGSHPGGGDDDDCLDAGVGDHLGGDHGHDRR
jgi:hypothetical protein